MRIENLGEYEAFGDDDLTDSTTDLDSNVVEAEDTNGGGCLPPLGEFVYFVILLFYLFFHFQS